MQTIIKNRYRIETLIGQGGMGAVYKAYDRLTGKAVALKQVTVPHKQLEMMTRASNTANQKTLLANEFSTLASLRHPNIISVLDYGFDDEGNPFFTMDLLEGGVQIKTYAADKTRDQQISYLLDILQALRYLHQRGILHRDLKPANILVTEDKLRLLDFGLAMDAAYAQEHDGAAGTLAYLAPEVLRGTAPSIASDLYAFGVLAYELFTGEHPFLYETQSELIQQVLLDIPNFSETKLDDDIGSVLMRLLSKDAEDRYASALDTMRAIGEAADYPLPPETVEIRESFLIASKFVGRETDVQTLKIALKQMLADGGQAYLIGGESGVGKTRLMDELRANALVEGVTVIRGQAVTEAGMPYKILRDILPELLLQTDISKDEAAILEYLLPNISNLLEREIPPSELSEDAIKLRLPLIISNLVAEASQKIPLLIMLEDLQWAADSIDILKNVLTSTTQNRVMIVGNYRSDEAPHLADELSMMQHMPLERLTEANIRQLSLAMLGDRGETYGVLDLIQRESEGNAFFIVEVVRALAEEVGHLSNIGLSTLPAQVFAGGIQKIIQRRMSKLPIWALYPVQLSSIIGRQINSALIQVILPQLDMQKWLSVCGEVAIFAASGDSWQFTHDKIREYVSTNLETHQTQHIHLQVANAIETLYADNLDDYAPVLAQHYQEAKNIEKEAFYASKAANVLQVFNPLDALRFLRRAIHLKAYDYTENPQYAFAELKLLMGYLSLKVSEFDTARQSLDTALATYQSINDEVGIAKAKNSLGEWGLMTSQFTEAIPYLEESIPILEAHEEWLQFAYANMNMAAIQNRLGNTEQSRNHNQKCYEIALQLGDEILVAKSLNNLAVIHDISGDWDKAIEIHNQALAMRRRLKDKDGISTSLVNMGLIEGDKGNHSLGREYLLEALSNSRGIGNKRKEANILNALGQTEKNLKNAEAALSYFEQALALSEQIGEIFMQIMNLQSLGDFYSEDDKLLALDYYYQALDRSRQMDVMFTKLNAINSITKLLIDTEDKSNLILWICAALKFADNFKNRDDFVERLTSLQTDIDSDSYDSACEQGQAMTIAELISDILEKRGIDHDE